LSSVVAKLVAQEKIGEPAKIVTTAGEVKFPGTYPLTNNMTFKDLIDGSGGFKTSNDAVTDLDYALLVRERLPTREIDTYHINPRVALDEHTSPENIFLAPRDKVVLFASNESRAANLTPVLTKLRAQEKLGEAARIVTVTGTIQFSGKYPLTENMSVRELVLAAGGLKESTYTSSAEITRKDYSNPEQATVRHFPISLKNILDTNEEHQDLLYAGDHLTLKLIPRYQEKLTVFLRGEVKFPGTYEFTRGETLSDIITRAGGLTDLAHVEAAYFSRVDLKAKESQQIAEFRERLKSDIAAAQLEDTNANKNTDVDTLNTLLANLENAKATGRLVVNLQGILN